MDWNIDTKLSTITLDNCSTNDAMIDKIKAKLKPEKLLRDGDLLHMRCCAHILNLIVKDGLEVVKDGIERIRDSVGFWVATPKRKEKFELTASQLKIPYTKNLVLDCPTRWNSTYKMLEVAILYEDVFKRLAVRVRAYRPCLPTTLQWKFAKDICKKLKIFNSITEVFSGTKYPTSNEYFPKICQIKEAIHKWIESSDVVIREMANKMLIKFDKYWSVIHEIMGVAAVLDPRYKTDLLEYYFGIFYGVDARDKVKSIQKLCYDLLYDYQSKTNDDCSADSQMVDSEISSVDNDGMAKYDLYVRKKKRARIGNVKTELDVYLEEEILPRRSDFDILMWWKLNGVKYPTLQAIARDVLAIPVFIVASESAFSTSGHIVSPHRSRLHWTTLEALMCTRSWLWSAESTGKYLLNYSFECKYLLSYLL
jgi:hypothetical protein